MLAVKTSPFLEVTLAEKTSCVLLSVLSLKNTVNKREMLAVTLANSSGLVNQRGLSPKHSDRCRK